MQTTRMLVVKSFKKHCAAGRKTLVHRSDEVWNATNARMLAQDRPPVAITARSALLRCSMGYCHPKRGLRVAITVRAPYPSGKYSDERSGTGPALLILSGVGLDLTLVYEHETWLWLESSGHQSERHISLKMVPSDYQPSASILARNGPRLADTQGCGECCLHFAYCCVWRCNSARRERARTARRIGSG